MSKFAAPNDAMRVATNRATPDKKYFYIPPAKFRETYAADVPEPQAQFMADSEQQLAQKAHPGSRNCSRASALDVSAVGRQGHRSARKPRGFCLPAGRGSSGD